MPPSVSTPTTSPLPILTAFAGEGAKGLVHVGALKALETKDVDIRGIAGTSAGAIGAASKACGYTADDMADPSSRTTILDQMALVDPTMITATDLFGRNGWKRVAAFRRLTREDSK